MHTLHTYIQYIDENTVADGGSDIDDYDDDVQFISTNLIQLVNYMPPQRLYYFSENQANDTLRGSYKLVSVFD